MNTKEEISIEEIPSDELVEMTELWHRAFNAAGCDPTCHCCNRPIKVGDIFKLAITSTFRDYHPYTRYNNSIDVMLCNSCTVSQYESQVVFRYKTERERKEVRFSQGRDPNATNKGCFRINGKIIH